MRSRLGLGALLLIVVTSDGCIFERGAGICGRSLVQRDQYFGDITVMGARSHLIALAGSRIWCAHIFGDDNSVLIDDGATIKKIEFWGQRNLVSLPGDTLPEGAESDGFNIVILRGSGRVIVTPPPTSQPTSQKQTP